MKQDKMKGKLNNAMLFFSQALSSPKQIGAIVPSSRQLAQAMARFVVFDADSWVIELGPGTGSVTEVLLQQGIPSNRFMAIEKSPVLVEHLRKKFPAARILSGDAARLDEIILKENPQNLPIATIISCLPLLNFPSDLSNTISQKMHQILKPNGGRLIQFSYHLGQRQAPGLSLFHRVRTHLVWRNFPPARVSVYQP